MSFRIYQFQFLMKSCIISFILNNAAVIKIRPGKVYMARSADLGRMPRSLRRSREVLLTLLNIIFKCSSNDKRLLRTILNCFCELTSDTLLLFKNQLGMTFFTYFSSKYYFLSFFNWIRIETNFLLVSPFVNFK